MNELELNRSLPLYPGIISFGITFLRIILALLCIPFLGIKSFEFVVAGIIVAIMVFDHYDGKLFKLSSLNDIPYCRKIRRIFDSCGDRICIQIVCISLLSVNSRFILPYLIICLKEALTSIICIKAFKCGKIIYPSRVSKISTIFVGLTTISGIYNNILFIGIASISLVLTGVLSCLSYKDLINRLNAGKLAEGIEFEKI